MKIQKLTLDEIDMKEAVEAFLKQRGITMPVHSISKEYSWNKEYEVTFEFEVDQSAPPEQPEQPEPPEPAIVNQSEEKKEAL